MEGQQVSGWLAHIKTLIDGLDHVDTELLPASFAKDVMEPLRTSRSLADHVDAQYQRGRLLCDLAEISKTALDRTWYFWEKCSERLMMSARAASLEFYRMNSASILYKLHPVQPDEDAEEVSWPKTIEGPYGQTREEGVAQTFWLRCYRDPTDAVVLKFQTTAPVPPIHKGQLAALAECHQLLFAIFQAHLPSLPLPKVLEVTAAPSIEERDEDRILGRDPSFLKAVASLEQAAKSDATVYLRGESGTGKELFAKHLHQLSARGDGPFIPINCSAVPHELIESEMFGHEKGAFTGAYYRKIGKAEQAHGGTLFLDEIGEMPLPFQAKLLRYLQEKKFTRVGGNQPVHSDARIVVATHRDLKDMVAKKQFREDLFYRIHVIPVTIPPLRERGSDIYHLAEKFFHKYISKSRASRRKVDETVYDTLCRYVFPGNVRELDNIIQRTVVMTQKPLISAEDLPEELHEAAENPHPPFRLHPFEKFDHLLPKDRDSLRELKKEIDQVAFSYQRDLDRRFLLHLLEKGDGSARKAAELAEINRTLFYKLLKRAGLDIGQLQKENA